MIITNIRDKESNIDYIPSLLIIEEECFVHPWHEESFIELMNNKDALILVAVCEDDTVAGYISMLNVVGEGQILNVAVRSCVLFFFEILCAITLREKRSIITQI